MLYLLSKDSLTIYCRVKVKFEQIYIVMLTKFNNEEREGV